MFVFNSNSTILPPPDGDILTNVSDKDCRIECKRCRTVFVGKKPFRAHIDLCFAAERKNVPASYTAAYTPSAKPKGQKDPFAQSKMFSVTLTQIRYDHRYRMMTNGEWDSQVAWIADKSAF